MVVGLLLVGSFAVGCVRCRLVDHGFGSRVVIEQAIEPYSFDRSSVSIAG
jgi:hypothetical protein